MTPVFADTFYYLALANPRDATHRVAREFAQAFRGTIVTTSVVLMELGDALCQRSNRSKAVEWLKLVRTDPDTEVVQLAEDLFSRGIDLVRARTDKDWSLTDCVSFVVMTELDLTDALTGDHHFEQAGFHALLKSDAAN